MNSDSFIKTILNNGLQLPSISYFRLNFVANNAAMNCTSELLKWTWVAGRKFDFFAIFKLCPDSC